MPPKNSFQPIKGNLRKFPHNKKRKPVIKKTPPKSKKKQKITNVTITNSNKIKTIPSRVYKARKKLKPSSNFATKIRIRAMRGNMTSKGKYSSSSSNNEYNNRPYTSLYEKTLKKYTFKKIPNKNISFTNKHNKHGIAYMEANNDSHYLLPKKKNIQSKSKLRL